jgi:hypothetical protein
MISNHDSAVKAIIGASIKVKQDILQDADLLLSIEKSRIRDLNSFKIRQ